MKARLPKNYGGGIGNMQQLAMQAQKMQQKMEETTTELEEKEYSATAVSELPLNLISEDNPFFSATLETAPATKITIKFSTP